MNVLVNKYIWVFNLLVITICAFLAAKSLGHFVEARLPEVARRAVPAPVLQPALESGSREIGAILARNIFCSTCTPDESAAAQGPGADAPPLTGASGDERPVKTGLNVKLIATITSDEHPAWNFASIMDPSSDTAQLYTIGSKIPGDGVVTDILERHVLLRVNARAEYLALENPEGEQGGPGGEAAPPQQRQWSRPPPLAGLENVANGIKQVGPLRWELQRGLVGQVVSNQGLIGRGARIIPVMNNGKPDGFRFFGRKGSLASLLGLYGGDTIKALNGHPIKTPEQALEVVSKLRTANYLSLTFDRKGTEVTHEYVIK